MENSLEKVDFEMSLEDQLSAFLPSGATFKLLHLQSQTFTSKNLLLYRASDQHKPKHTLKVKHFFNLVDSTDLVLLGIEINVYITVFSDYADQHIFIAKADTTGVKSLNVLGIKSGNIISCILKYLLSMDVSCYCQNVKVIQHETESEVAHSSKDDDSQDPADESQNATVVSLYKAAAKVAVDSKYYRMVKDYEYRKQEVQKDRDIRESKKSVKIELPGPVYTHISLFTRAEKQYLYPESFQNPHKHIIDGKQLLSWWLKIINQVLHDVSGEDSGGNWDCRLSIPGSDDVSTTKFHTSLSKYEDVKWSNGSIFDKSEDELAIYQIPLFPDDPKGRFLEHLVVENRYKATSLRQFWEELGIRQEFRLGNLVGIIGCSSKGTSTSLGKFSQSKTISFGDYKRIADLVKGQDYSKSDVRDLITKDVPEALKEIGKEGQCIVSIQGKMPRKVNVISAQSATPQSANDGSKRSQVNNLTGLVKRKKKT